ncbi:RIP metalloprotease RseP [soil metagenome]
MIITLLIFLVILSALVLIHELGHFLVARKFGMKVEEFGFGLPPRVWGIKKGETIYSINWLPIGGFVKVYGEDDAGAGKVSLKTEKKKAQSGDDKRAFYARSWGQRAAVVVAGVVMNTLLAIFIFYTYMLVSGFHSELPLLGEHHFFGVTQTNTTAITVEDVEKNSPAGKAGLPVLARITSLNGKQVSGITQFTASIKNAAGKSVNISYIDPKSNKTVTKSITPRVNPPKGQGALGVGLYGMTTAVLNYQTPVQKVFSGIIHPANLLVYNFDLIGQLIKSSIKHHDATALSEGVSGPVGIYSIVGTIVKIPDMKERVLELLNLAGILSISLAFFNVLPIPALDGGRLFFILFEGVTGKKVNPKYETLAHTIGMAVLLVLILLVTFKDIFQFLL